MCWNAASLPRRFELSGEQDAIHQVVGAYYEAFARDPAGGSSVLWRTNLNCAPERNPLRDVR